MSERPNVFLLSSPREVFSKWLRWLDPEGKLTHRALGEKVGLSHGHLGLVLRGARPLPTGAVWASLVQTLGFDPEEARFVQRLDEAQRARSPMARAEAHRLLAAERSAHLAAEAPVSIFERWYLPVLMELWSCAGAPRDPALIAAALRPPVPVAEVEHALAQLGVTGERSTRLSTGEAPDAEALREFYRVTLTLAAEAAATLSQSERERQAFTAAVSPATLERLRDRMRQDIRGWMELCERDEGPRDRVLQITAVALPAASWVPEPE